MGSIFLGCQRDENFVQLPKAGVPLSSLNEHRFKFADNRARLSMQVNGISSSWQYSRVLHVDNWKD